MNSRQFDGDMPSSREEALTNNYEKYLHIFRFGRRDLGILRNIYNYVVSEFIYLYNNIMKMLQAGSAVASPSLCWAIDELGDLAENFLRKCVISSRSRTFLWPYSPITAERNLKVGLSLFSAVLFQ